MKQKTFNDRAWRDGVVGRDHRTARISNSGRQNDDDEIALI